jgi:hypothetical protein
VATRAEIIDANQAGINRVISTFSQLSADQLETRVYEGDDGWTARQILAHLANRKPTYDLLISMALDGSGAAPGGFSLESWNQELVNQREGAEVDELLNELQQVHNALRERVETFREDQLNLPLVLPNRETNLGDALLGSGGMHAFQHTKDVEAALGIDPDD